MSMLFNKCPFSELVVVMEHDNFEKRAHLVVRLCKGKMTYTPPSQNERPCRFSQSQTVVSLTLPVGSDVPLILPLRSLCQPSNLDMMGVSRPLDFNGLASVWQAVVSLAKFVEKMYAYLWYN